MLIIIIAMRRLLFLFCTVKTALVAVFYHIPYCYQNNTCITSSNNRDNNQQSSFIKSGGDRPTLHVAVLLGWETPYQHPCRHLPNDVLSHRPRSTPTRLYYSNNVTVR